MIKPSVYFLLLTLSACSLFYTPVPYEHLLQPAARYDADHRLVHISGSLPDSALAITSISQHQAGSTVDVELTSGIVHGDYQSGTLETDVDVSHGINQIMLAGHLVWTREQEK